MWEKNECSWSSCGVGGGDDGDDGVVVVVAIVRGLKFPCSPSMAMATSVPNIARM